MLTTSLQNNIGFLSLDINPDASQKINSGFVTNNLGVRSKIDLRGISRMSLTFIWYPSTIPNVDVKNNLIVFRYNTNLFTAVLDTGIYTDPVELMEEIIRVMNLAATAGITYTILHGLGALNAGGGNVMEILEADRMKWLWDPQIGGGETQIKSFGPIVLLYSRYFDIKSKILTEDTKSLNVTSDDGASSIISRIHFDNTLGVGQTTGFEIVNSNWVRIRPDRAINQIDIEILDEYNELLRILQPNGQDNTETLFFILQFNYELKPRTDENGLVINW